MNPILLGIMAGIAGTLVMDVTNHLLSQRGLLLNIDIRMIGRMSAGWVRGRFRYHNPQQMQASGYERVLGWITHYAISLIFALTYVLGWHFLIGDPVSAVWALVYGIATTIASLCLVFPSMGFGLFGRRSPHGLRAPLSSLANHTFFGIGMALVIALV